MTTETLFTPAYQAEVFRHGSMRPLRIITDQAGRRWFIGVEIATLAGFSAPRDAHGRHVPNEHRLLLETPWAERVTGNPKTKRVMLIDRTGVEMLLGRSKNCSPAFGSEVLRAIDSRQTNRFNEANLESRSAGSTESPATNATPTQPQRVGGLVADESLIMAQALEIANRKLAAASVKHYPPNHLFTATEIGEPFGLSALALNKILEREKVQYSVRRDGRPLWLLSPVYRNQAFAWVRDVEKNGRLVPCLLWTWKGKQMIEGVLQRAGVPRKGD